MKDKPTHIILCLDTSGSITSLYPQWGQSIQLISRSFAGLSAPALYSVVLWNNSIQTAGMPFAERITGDELARRIRDDPSRLTRGAGGTEPYHGLYGALQIAQRATTPEDILVIILTDGTWDIENYSYQPVDAWGSAPWEGFRNDVNSLKRRHSTLTVQVFYPEDVGDVTFGRKFDPPQKTQPNFPAEEFLPYRLDNLGHMSLFMSTTAAEWMVGPTGRPGARARTILNAEGISPNKPETLPPLWQLGLEEKTP